MIRKRRTPRPIPIIEKMDSINDLRFIDYKIELKSVCDPQIV